MKRYLLILLLVVAASLLSTFAGAQGVIEHPAAEAELYKDNDGNLWRAYDTGDGAVVSMSVRYMHYRGRYYLVDLYILNTSDRSVAIDFDDARMYSTSGRVKVFDHDGYVRRIRRRNNWRAFGSQMAMMAAAITVDLLIEGSYQSSSRHSLGRDLLTDLAEDLVMDAAYVGSALIWEHYGAQNGVVAQDNLGYFHNTTLRGNSAVQGHFFAKYAGQSPAVSLEIPIGGRVHRFTAPTLQLQEVRARE